MGYYQQQRDFPRGKPRFPQPPASAPFYDNYAAAPDNRSPQYGGQHQPSGLLLPPPPTNSVAATAPNLPPNPNYANHGGAQQFQQHRYQIPYQQQPHYQHQFQQHHNQPFQPPLPSTHQHQHQTPPQQYGRPVRHHGNQRNFHRSTHSFGRGSGFKRPYVSNSASYQGNSNSMAQQPNQPIQPIQPPLPRDSWQGQDDGSWSMQPTFYEEEHQQQQSRQLQASGSLAPSQPFEAPPPTMPYSPAPGPVAVSMQPSAPMYQPRDPHRATNNSRPPPPNYVCHKCRQPGHWIQDCLLGYRHSSNPTPAVLPPPPPLPPGPIPPFDDVPVMDHQRTNSLQHEISGGGGSASSGVSSGVSSGGGATKNAATGSDTKWRCEACDKNFVMLSQHEAHVKTHVQCWATDCEFEASKRVVSAHFQTCHGVYSGQGLKEIDVEGQKFMVLVGNSPEDITKWREERRKKWPSVRNLQHKQDTLLKRQQALGRVPMPPASSTSTGSSAADAGSKEVAAVAGTKRKHSEDDTEDRSAALEEGEVHEDEEDRTAPPPTTGPSASAASPSVDSAVAIAGTDQQKPVPKSRPCTKFVKGCCRFGSRCRFSHDLKSFACSKLLITGKCLRGNKCLFSHDQALCDMERPKYQAKAQAHAHAATTGTTGTNATATKTHKKPKLAGTSEQQVEQLWQQENKSLLRKLLQKDIRREQRQLLQIIHFAVTKVLASVVPPPSGEQVTTADATQQFHTESIEACATATSTATAVGDTAQPGDEDDEEEEEEDLPLPNATSAPSTAVQVAVA